MSTWTESAIDGRTLVTAERDGFSIAFFRQPNASVWVMLTSDSAGGSSFDEDRCPILWVDDLERVDLGVMKHITDLDIEKNDVYFVGSKEHVISQIWHGEGSLDRGLIKDILNGKELNIQIYTQAFDVLRYRISLDTSDTTLFKRVLKFS